MWIPVGHHGAKTLPYLPGGTQGILGVPRVPWDPLGSLAAPLVPLRSPGVPCVTLGFLRGPQVPSVSMGFPGALWVPLGPQSVMVRIPQTGSSDQSENQSETQKYQSDTMMISTNVLKKHVKIMGFPKCL